MITWQGLRAGLSWAPRRSTAMIFSVSWNERDLGRLDIRPEGRKSWKGLSSQFSRCWNCPFNIPIKDYSVFAWTSPPTRRSSPCCAALSLRKICLTWAQDCLRVSATSHSTSYTHSPTFYLLSVSFFQDTTGSFHVLWMTWSPCLWVWPSWFTSDLECGTQNWKHFSMVLSSVFTLLWIHDFLSMSVC